ARARLRADPMRRATLWTATASRSRQQRCDACVPDPRPGRAADRETPGARIPLGEFTTARGFYNDEREQFFTNSLHPELYSDRLTATSLAFGAGVGILENLSVGLSFTLNLTNTAQSKTYVRDPID